MTTRFRKNKARLGIDIVDNKIYALLCLKTTRQIKIVAHACAHFQSGSKKSFLNAIERIRQKIACNNAPIIFGLPLEHAIINEHTLDAQLNDEHLLQYFSKKSTELFGCKFEQLNFDYEILRDRKNEPNLQTIRSVAARKRDIEQVTKPIATVFGQLQAIDINLFALIRGINSILKPNNEYYAIVLFKAARLSFCVVQNKQLIYQKIEDYYCAIEDIDDTIKRGALNRCLQYYRAISNTEITQFVFITPDGISNELTNNFDCRNIVTSSDQLPNHSLNWLGCYGLCLWGNEQ